VSVSFVCDSEAHREEKEVELLLNSVKKKAADFDAGLIAEVEASLPRLTKAMKVNWNISLCLCI
jgi:hypothetical protein